MGVDVSVLMPCRNAGSTLEEAADSVLSQSHVTVEVVLVHDTSDDATRRVAARLAARHSALRVVDAPQPGLVAALNHGLSLCSAALLARMDADDVSLPGRLHAQAEALRAAPALDVLATRVQAFPAEDVAGGLARYVGWQNTLLTPDDHARQLFVEAPLCHPSVMLRRATLQAVGGYRAGPFPEDYDLWLRLQARGARLAKLPGVLLRWRQHPGRATLTDPRYARERFTALKAPFLARRLLASPLALDVWGAGQTGRRLLRELERHGVRARRFIDIDPRKIGRTARGLPIVSPDELGDRGAGQVLVAVGAAGARDLVRAHLNARGYREGTDYLCGA